MNSFPVLKWRSTKDVMALVSVFEYMGNLYQEDSGEKRQVLNAKKSVSDTHMPGTWQFFLRDDKNKEELYIIIALFT